MPSGARLPTALGGVGINAGKVANLPHFQVVLLRRRRRARQSRLPIHRENEQLRNMWGRMPSGARLPTALGGVGINVGKRVVNPLQVANLPHFHCAGGGGLGRAAFPSIEKTSNFGKMVVAGGGVAGVCVASRGTTTPTPPMKATYCFPSSM